MKTFYNLFTAALVVAISSSVAAQCTISHGPGTNVTTGGGFLWGQSFSTTCDGELDYVEFTSNSTGTVSAGTLKIYNGNQVTTPFYTQPHPAITITNSGDPMRVYVTGSVPVSNATQYTFEFFVDNVNVLADWANLYPGGIIWQNGGQVTGNDFVFEVEIKSACQDSLPQLNAFGASNDTICPGDTVTLTAAGNLNDAKWWQLYTDSCGGTAVALDTGGVFMVSPTTTTTYFVRGEDSTTCVNEDSSACMSITIEVTNIDSTVSQNISDLTANQAGATYQWLECDSNFTMIPNETSQTFSPDSNGIYAVAITLDGCTDTSACTTVNNVGIHDGAAKSSASLFPNPTTGMVTITGYKGTIEVTDIIGRPVLRTNQSQIDLSNQPNGVYFIGIGKTTLKLIKQ